MSNSNALVQQYTVQSRNPNARPAFRMSWGAKTEGIMAGDYVDGIILGFEISEFGAKNIVLKSFTHNGQTVMVWGCSSLQRELHFDEAFTQLLFKPGDAIRIIYQGGYTGKKGKSQGKFVAIFQIGELVGYQLTQQDVGDIQKYIQEQSQKNPYYQQSPIQQPHYSQQQLPSQQGVAYSNNNNQPQQLNHVHRVTSTPTQPVSQQKSKLSFDI